MNINSFLILLSLTIASPLQPVGSASLPDFTNNFQLDAVSNEDTYLPDSTNFQLDPVSNENTVVSSSNDPSLVEQPQPPLPGISTPQDTGPPIIDSGLDTVQVQPSFPSSESDMTGSRFELAQNSPAGGRTVDAVYLCCQSKGEDKFLCDDRQQNDKLIWDYCAYTVYLCPKGRQITSLSMECQDKSAERVAEQSGMAVGLGGVAAIITCLLRVAEQHGLLACVGLPSAPNK